MSLRTGIGHLYDITVEEAIRAGQLIRDAIKAVLWFRRWWQTADPFQKYRIVQVPTEIVGIASPLGIAVLAETIFPGGSMLSLVVVFEIAISSLLAIMIGKSRLLKRVRKKLILPIPNMIFVCARCGHWEIFHLGHPGKKCRFCKLGWRNEGADYQVEPTSIEIRMDDLYPGMYR